MSERSIPDFDSRYEMPITKDVSQFLAESYRYTCQLSGVDVQLGSFHVDHIFPRALGGPDNLQNYVIACAAANIGKSARRLSIDDEIRLLEEAKLRAPTLLRDLTHLRADTGGRPINPLVVYAFRLIGAEVGSRVATGAYLRAKNGPAPGVMWWGYYGPDRANGVSNDILQFGVKVLGAGKTNIRDISALLGIVARGGSTWYFPIDASLPLRVDRNALENARHRIAQACR